MEEKFGYDLRPLPHRRVIPHSMVEQALDSMERQLNSILETLDDSHSDDQFGLLELKSWVEEKKSQCQQKQYPPPPPQFDTTLNQNQHLSSEGPRLSNLENQHNGRPIIKSEEMNMMERGQKNLDRRKGLGRLQSNQLDNKEDNENSIRNFDHFDNRSTTSSSSQPRAQHYLNTEYEEGQFDSTDEDEEDYSEDKLHNQMKNRQSTYQRPSAPINQAAQYMFFPPPLPAHFINPPSSQQFYVPKSAFPAQQQPMFLQPSVRQTYFPTLNLTNRTVTTKKGNNSNKPSCRPNQQLDRQTQWQERQPSGQRMRNPPPDKMIQQNPRNQHDEGIQPLSQNKRPPLNQRPLSKPPYNNSQDSETTSSRKEATSLKCNFERMSGYYAKSADSCFQNLHRGSKQQEN